MEIDGKCCIIVARKMEGKSFVMRIMAIDYGDARTGIAVSDAMGVLVGEAWVIKEYSAEKVADAIAASAHERGVERLVLGYPLNMDGSAGESAREAEMFAQRLREKTGRTVVLRDERGTTVSAHRYLNETDTRGKKRKAVVDAVAAVIILQDYLEYRRIHRG